MFIDNPTLLRSAFPYWYGQAINILLLRSKIFIRVADGEVEFGFDISGGGAQVFEVEKIMVQQVRWCGVAERIQHRGTDVRNLFFQIRDQGFDARPF